MWMQFPHGAWFLTLIAAGWCRQPSRDLDKTYAQAGGKRIEWNELNDRWKIISR
jgi:hypothetical protein